MQAVRLRNELLMFGKVRLPPQIRIEMHSGPLGIM